MLGGDNIMFSNSVNNGDTFDKPENLSNKKGNSAILKLQHLEIMCM